MIITRETAAFRVNGFMALVLQLALGITLFVVYRDVVTEVSLASAVTAGVGVLAFLVMMTGYVVLQPNEAKALVFFGRYVGTARSSGFSWVVPLSEKLRISLRVRNFNGGTLKVNDAGGNPIEIAAVVVWRVADTAKALFDVDQYEQFVAIQAETALRKLASSYVYDSHETGGPSLLGSQSEVASALRDELEQRLSVAGVHVLEAKLTHLAYAPEVAQAMLRRQQAEAILSARRLIVQGAVGMVRLALEQLESQGIVALDGVSKASLVSNLLVVLTSDQGSQPVLSVGTSRPTE